VDAVFSDRLLLHADCSLFDCCGVGKTLIVNRRLITNLFFNYEIYVAGNNFFLMN